jgi:hypothetical protein
MQAPDGSWLHPLARASPAARITPHFCPRLFAGGQWQRALDIYTRVPATHTVHASTVTALVMALGKGDEALRAEELLLSLAEQAQAGAGAGGALTREALVPAWNSAIRALARQGHRERALAQLERMVLRDELPVYSDTVGAGGRGWAAGAAGAGGRGEGQGGWGGRGGRGAGGCGWGGSSGGRSAVAQQGGPSLAAAATA